MEASKNCIAIIKKFEGLRLIPYLCPAGVPTIGFGSTQYANGKPVTLIDHPITEAEAIELLMTTLRKYVSAVNSLVKKPINQNQFDALVDFAYNAGVGALQTSTLLKKINLNDFKGASLEFPKWIHAEGKVLSGLVERRKFEQDLFNKAI
jgi:lysozyme